MCVSVCVHARTCVCLYLCLYHYHYTVTIVLIIIIINLQVLSMSEELRRALYASNAASLDIELFLPDLVGVTEIFSEEHRKKLCRHLPARAEGKKCFLTLGLNFFYFPLYTYTLKSPNIVKINVCN